MKTQKQFKRILSLVLVLLMMTSTVSEFTLTGSAEAAYTATADWKAESDGIFYIDDVNDFLAFIKNKSANASYSGKTIKLRADIDFSGVTFPYTDGAGSKIGDASGRNCFDIFSGTLDGCGYAIKNLSFTANNNIGLFRRLTNGTVKNLKITGGTITQSGGTNNAFGSVCGEATGNSTIENVYAKTTIAAKTDNTGTKNIGGLVGMVGLSDTDAASLTIRNCVSECTMSGYQYIGGLVGGIKAAATANIIDSAFVGSISSASQTYQGALVGGTCGNLNVSRCLALGTIRSSSSNQIGMVTVLNGTAYKDIVLDDVYVARQNTRFAPNGDYIIATTENTGCFDVTIKYNDEAVYTSEGKDVFADIVSLNSAVKTLAVAESKTYTQESFEEACPALSDTWVVIPNETVAFGKYTITKILPKTVAGMLGYSPVTVTGAQMKTNDAGKTDIRIVGLVNFDDLNAYSHIGFDVVVKKNGTEIVNTSVESTTVYNSIVAANEIVTAESFGASYIYGLVINNFESTGVEYTITVKAFAKNANTTVYDYEGDLSITFKDGVLTSER